MLYILKPSDIIETALKVYKKKRSFNTITSVQLILYMLRRPASDIALWGIVGVQPNSIYDEELSLTKIVRAAVQEYTSTKNL